MINRKSTLLAISEDTVLWGATTPFMLKATTSSLRPTVCVMFFRISAMRVEGYAICTKHSLERRERICNYRETKSITITFVIVGACTFCTGEKVAGFVAGDMGLGAGRFRSIGIYGSRRSMKRS